VSDALGIDANDVHTRLMQESNGSDPSPLLLQLRDELQLNSEAVETEPYMAVDEDDADIVEELDPEEDAVSEAGETVDETIFSEPSALLDDEVDPSESTQERTSTLDAGEESGGSNKDASQSRLSDSSEGVAVADDSSSTAPVKSKFQENWDIYKKEIADQVKSDLRRVQSVVALVVPPWLRLVLLQIVTKAWMVVHVGTRAASRALNVVLKKAQEPVWRQRCATCWRRSRRWLLAVITP